MLAQHSKIRRPAILDLMQQRLVIGLLEAPQLVRAVIPNVKDRRYIDVVDPGYGECGKGYELSICPIVLNEPVDERPMSTNVNDACGIRHR